MFDALILSPVSYVDDLGPQSETETQTESAGTWTEFVKQEEEMFLAFMVF